MRIRVDERFGVEAARLGLLYRCPDCVYFLPAADDATTGTCAHEWPNEMHLAPTPTTTADVDFCKEFETA